MSQLGGRQDVGFWGWKGREVWILGERSREGGKRGRGGDEVNVWIEETLDDGPVGTGHKDSDLHCQHFDTVQISQEQNR